MASLRQFLAILGLSAASFPGRWKSSLVIVTGLAIVTAVPLSLLALGESLKDSYLRAGMPDRVLVLSRAAHTQFGSHIPLSWADAILKAKGVRQWQGRPLVDFEVAAGLHPLKRAKAEKGDAVLRGFGPLGFAMRPELKLLAGHLPLPGSQEVIVGLQAQRKFAGFDIGRKIEAAGRSWAIVGVFETGNTLDGDVLADAGALKAARRRDDFNSVFLALASPASLEQVRTSLQDLPVMALRETD